MSRPIALITGATGFLGSYLSKACAADGMEVIGLARKVPVNRGAFSSFVAADLATSSAVEELGDIVPDYCFHLAGSSSVPGSIDSPIEDFNSLVPGTQRILDFLSRKKKRCHCVLFSSAAVYGNPVGLPVTEAAEVRPLSPYGIHKALAEALVFNYGRLSDTPVTVLRIFSGYGAGLNRQVIWDAFNKLLSARDSGVPAVFNGTGSETRDFVHASDVVRLALAVVRQPERSNGVIFNSGAGREVAIRDVIERVSSHLHWKAGFSFSGAKRAGDPERWCADISRTIELGAAPMVAFEEGLTSTINSYLHVHRTVKRRVNL